MISSGLRAAIAASMPGGLVLVGAVGTTFNNTASPAKTLNGTLTNGIATTPATGDIVFAALSQGSNIQRTLTVSGNQSGAYTPICSLHADDSVDANLALFYKVMGATPDSTLTGAGFEDDAESGGILHASVWRGQHSSPLDVTPTTNSGIDTNRTTPPAITPARTGANVLVWASGVWGSTRLAALTLAGFNVVASIVSTGSERNTKLLVGWSDWASGTATPAQCGDTDPDSTGAAHASCTVALRPA